MSPGPTEIDERFSAGLDETLWTAAYLPAWSSADAAAAAVSVQPDGLRLGIPTEHPLWCPDLHDPPMRVSAVQSGNWSGPVGSTRGQQPFRDGLVVREFQLARWAFTPRLGYVEVSCRAEIGPGSMFSAWLIGIEDEPERCAEICLVEVFGDTVAAGSVALGRGIHKFRDPRVEEDFAADRYDIDVREFHRYAVDWRADRVDFFVDGVLTKTAHQAPDYPMQLILGVFDFPSADRSGGAVPEPALIVGRVRGRPR